MSGSGARITVAQLKTELKELGIQHKSNLKKAELLALLEDSKTKKKDDHYSPPYTRRRTMRIVNETVTVKTLKLDQSPGNPAAAVLDDQDIVEDIDSSSHSASVTNSSSQESDIDAQVKATPEVRRRRSARLTPKHLNNEVKAQGVLFSEGEDVEELPTTKEVEVEQPSPTSRALSRLLIVALLVILLVNGIAYIHYTYPNFFPSLHKRAVDHYHRLISPVAIPSKHG